MSDGAPAPKQKLMGMGKFKPTNPKKRKRSPNAPSPGGEGFGGQGGQGFGTGVAEGHGGRGGGYGSFADALRRLQLRERGGHLSAVAALRVADADDVTRAVRGAPSGPLADFFVHAEGGAACRPGLARRLRVRARGPLRRAQHQSSLRRRDRDGWTRPRRPLAAAFRRGADPATWSNVPVTVLLHAARQFVYAALDYGDVARRRGGATGLLATPRNRSRDPHLSDDRATKAGETLAKIAAARAAAAEPDDDEPTLRRRRASAPRPSSTADDVDEPATPEADEPAPLDDGPAPPGKGDEPAALDDEPAEPRTTRRRRAAGAAPRAGRGRGARAARDARRDIAPRRRAQAHGLAFSIKDGADCKFPPSLRRIIRECQEDVGAKPPPAGTGDLEGDANSHAEKGWETFTDAVVRSPSRAARASRARTGSSSTSSATRRASTGRLADDGPCDATVSLRAGGADGDGDGDGRADGQPGGQPGLLAKPAKAGGGPAPRRAEADARELAELADEGEARSDERVAFDETLWTPSAPTSSPRPTTRRARRRARRAP
ncbi:amino acid transmembrane transporter [Aureococcus anophagefferens]|nr:amino acid transmembrane transporter [Aureococcus anophagefferens]